MSTRAREWAWDQALSGTQKMLLVALAEHANEEGVCWPSQARLAAMCAISDRQARTHLARFQELGLVVVEHRPGDGAGRKSNVYRLCLGDRTQATGSDDRGGETATGSLAQATGSRLPVGLVDKSDFSTGNRKSGAGNRKPASAEPPLEPSISQYPPQEVIPNPARAHAREGSGRGGGDESLVFPERLTATERGQATILLNGCEPEWHQDVLDELAGMIAKGTIRTAPLTVLRSLVSRARIGRFTLELGQAVREGRERERRLRHVEAREASAWPDGLPRAGPDDVAKLFAGVRRRREARESADAMDDANPTTTTKTG